MKKLKKKRQLIKDYLKWWIHWMGLGYGQIDVCFAEYLDGGNTDANVHSDWRYQYSKITFSDSAIRDMKKDKLEELVVHELMHIFLNEMREGKIKHEERVATQLQKAFMWVRGAKKEKNDKRKL